MSQQYFDNIGQAFAKDGWTFEHLPTVSKFMEHPLDVGRRPPMKNPFKSVTEGW
jgi:hypothetical protein